MDVTGKHILLGVCGGIAAYKACELVRALQRHGADNVSVILTPDAEAFVGRLTFEALTRQPVITDPLAVAPDGTPWHIALAQQADVFCIVPATANTLAKLAHGMADDMVSTTAISWTGKPLVVAPAMNPRMWTHPQVSHNAKVVASFPFATVVPPAEGLLACGETGVGHLPSETALLLAIYRACHPQANHYAGLHAVVTAGGTHEPIDPVRHLTNRSSGKMGVAFADELYAMGATVTLIAGPTVADSLLVDRPYAIQRADTALALKQQLETVLPNAHLLVMAAAVSDYHVASPAHAKVKRTAAELQLTLAPNPDVLASVAAQFPQVFCLGFAAETDDAAAMQFAQEKLTRKGIDALCLNDVSRSDIGFDSAENEITLFTANTTEPVQRFPKTAKPLIARQVLVALQEAIQQKASAQTKTAHQ